MQQQKTGNELKMQVWRPKVYQFQLRVEFHIKTSHLICSTNQMAGFYMKCNTGLKWVNEIANSKLKVIFKKLDISVRYILCKTYWDKGFYFSIRTECKIIWVACLFWCSVHMRKFPDQRNSRFSMQFTQYYQQILLLPSLPPQNLFRYHTKRETVFACLLAR